MSTFKVPSPFLQIIIPHDFPGCSSGGLRGYVEEFVRRPISESEFQAIRCTGWEMYHDFASEPPVDMSQPLLAQRRYWYRNELYDKVSFPRLAKCDERWHMLIITESGIAADAAHAHPSRIFVGISSHH